jgi:hypothetical protein
MGKTSGSGMNNPDHNSRSLETIFSFKILKFFYADLGWKIFGSGIGDGKNSDPGFEMAKFGSRIRDKHPGSETLVYSEFFFIFGAGGGGWRGVVLGTANPHLGFHISSVEL